VGGEGGTKAVLGGIKTHVSYEDFQTKYSRLGLLTKSGLGRRGAVFGIQNSRRRGPERACYRNATLWYQATACFRRFD
jgi:hypothetical protein